MSILSSLHLQELLMFFIGTFVSLFSIVDPLMAAPLFVTLTDGQTAAQRNQVARRASIFSFVILGIFFITGSLILNFFQISIDALRIAGGLMILSSAYGMLNKKDSLDVIDEQEAHKKAVAHDDIAFSPLAMPILSGPGAIAVIIGMTTNTGGSVAKYLVILLAIMAVCFSSYLTMRVSQTIMNRMGPTIVKAFTRIMGFILLCVGVQFMVNGIAPLLAKALHGH
ncbi:MarC family NAAT transporter [Vampirovibrio chlorellavorus]|uniref:MarC family NAAT transporter n=1 Tax=Vampirovibrio chlorellavorus TaxID=758823 RepID=UPI0026F23AF4|nr:MarC family NAAT transporter [Vampirovibrio chlorellavorus]